jgi:hypothetical protein
MPFISWLAGKVTGQAIKVGGEVARTATEIPKNIAETQKARLEIKELHAKRDDRQRIVHPATFDDVRRFDPHVRAMMDGQMFKHFGLSDDRSYKASMTSGIVANLLLLLVLGLIIWGSIHLVRLIFR